MKCIELDSFELEKIDIKNKKHLKVIKNFDYDTLVRKYNYPCRNSFYSLVVNNKYSNTIFNNFYIIKEEDKAIGYIEIEDSKNIFLNYAIVKEERKKGYATRVLRELSNYLLNNYSNIVDSVYTIIDKRNKNSILVSTNSGFSLVEESNGYKTYCKKR